MELPSIVCANPAHFLIPNITWRQIKLWNFPHIFMTKGTGWYYHMTCKVSQLELGTNRPAGVLCWPKMQLAERKRQNRHRLLFISILFKKLHPRVNFGRLQGNIPHSRFTFLFWNEWNLLLACLFKYTC